MMKFGAFSFELKGVIPQSVGRSNEYRWGWIDLMGKRPAGQFTGIGSETMQLEGLYFPEFASSNFFMPYSADPLAPIRLLAETGIPQPLVMAHNGGGKNLGMWVVTNISQTSDVFYAEGVPRKIAFNLSLRRWA